VIDPAIIPTLAKIKTKATIETRRGDGMFFLFTHAIAGSAAALYRIPSDHWL
jgi:hypothetical protein